MRELLFGLSLVACSICVIVGVAHWSPGFAWIIAGLLGALVSFLVLQGGDGVGAETDDSEPVE